jgi:NADPH:quinone reductase
LPAGIDERGAVAVLHSALTAAVGLHQKARPRPGETMFLKGGSGNVGTVVLQVAKAMGVRVAVTAGNDKDRSWCEELGADLVMNYKTENIEDRLHAFAPEGVHVFWDLTPAPEVEQALNVVARRGRIVLMSGLSHRPPFPVGLFYTKNCTMDGFTITDASVAELRECAEHINSWLARNLIRGRIHAVMPLAAAADAHRLQEQGGLDGKIVLLPDPLMA